MRGGLAIWLSPRREQLNGSDGQMGFDSPRIDKGGAGVGAAAAWPKWMSAAHGDSGYRLSVTGPDSLRAHAAAHGFMYGAAVNPPLLDVDGLAAGGSTDAYTQLVVGQANIVVAENAMKWAGLRPTSATFEFSLADKLMRFVALAVQ